MTGTNTPTGPAQGTRHTPTEIWQTTSRMAVHHLRKKDREKLAYWLKKAEADSGACCCMITTGLMKSGLSYGERIESVHRLAFDLNECLRRLVGEVSNG